jgi:tRNA modification GTPase
MTASPEVDTIAAVATARGPGALAVVRLSGPRAHAILGALTREGRPAPPSRVATLLALHDPTDGSELDRALVTRYDAPASYTGEDMVEVSCHGGWLVPGLVLQAMLDAGARLAEPGEFTRRGYLHGKLDLVQAEAVADLVEARSRAMHRAALVQLDEGLSRRVTDLRRALVRLEALLAHHVDFPEEDDAPVPLTRIAAEADVLVGRLDALLSTAPEGALLREGALAVLAGLPNTGKSSLYNALIGEERAIVTEEPGTTRDALEASVQMGGYPFRLVDTAGLRDAGERVERMGIEVARKQLARADVVLLCVEAGRPAGDAERGFPGTVPGVPVVLVETKTDLDAGSAGQDDAAAAGWGAAGTAGQSDAATAGRSSALTAGPGDGGPAGADVFAGKVRVSARTGHGMDTLRSLLPGLVYAGLVVHGDDQPVVTRQRQARALASARDEIRSFGRALADGVPAEVAAAHLRSAETALEELVGVVSVEDVLDVVFREFCVGK